MVTEISYKPGSSIEADVIFVERSEWEKELEILLHDVIADEAESKIRAENKFKAESKSKVDSKLRSGRDDRKDKPGGQAKADNKPQPRKMLSDLAKVAWSKVRIDIVYEALLPD